MSNPYSESYENTPTEKMFNLKIENDAEYPIGPFTKIVSMADAKLYNYLACVLKQTEGNPFSKTNLETAIQDISNTIGGTSIKDSSSLKYFINDLWDTGLVSEKDSQYFANKREIKITDPSSHAIHWEFNIGKPELLWKDLIVKRNGNKNSFADDDINNLFDDL